MAKSARRHVDELENHAGRRRLLLFYVLLLAVMAFLFDSPLEIFQGLERIVVSPSVLLTDYMAVGGVGAALFNAAIMTLVSILTLRLAKAPVNGAVMAAVLTLSGFSLFGKNIFNTLPISFGVWLYACATRSPFRQHILVALYGTALGPMVSTLAFGLNAQLPRLSQAELIAIGYGAGILAGFIMPPLAANFIRFHQGYNLYNTGFTAGIIGMMMVGILEFSGLKLPEGHGVYHGDTPGLAVFLYGLFLTLTLLGFFLNGKGFRGYVELCRSSGRLVADFTTLYGFPLTFINMGFLGILATTCALAVGGELNGPIIGGILTVVGFGAFGKHLRNVLPIMAGVLLFGLAIFPESDPTLTIITGLFGTTLAPIAGQYGILAGIAAGFMHTALVLKVGALHAGVNLYNNGFSGGFIAAFLVPLLDIHRLSPWYWRNISARHRMAKALRAERNAGLPPRPEDKPTEKSILNSAVGLGSSAAPAETTVSFEGKRPIRAPESATLLPLTLDSEEERLLISNIIRELMGYFQSLGIEEFKIKVKQEDDVNKIRIACPCPELPVDLRRLERSLNTGRETVFENSYRYLLRSDAEGHELPLVAAMVDRAKVDYNAGWITMELERDLRD